MKKEEVIGQLKELREDRRSFMLGDYDECYDKYVQALEYAIKKLTAQEVPVQEQLLKINRNIKFTQCSVIVCSLFTIIGLDLFFNRFNESIQGITYILNNNVSITRTILDVLQTITNVFVNF